MIRTARILMAGLLHVLAAKVDVNETHIVYLERDYDPMDECADAFKRSAEAWHDLVAIRARNN